VAHASYSFNPRARFQHSVMALKNLDFMRSVALCTFRQSCSPGRCICGPEMDPPAWHLACCSFVHYGFLHDSIKNALSNKLSSILPPRTAGPFPASVMRERPVADFYPRSSPVTTAAPARIADIVIIREARGTYSPLILDIVTAASTKHNVLGSFCSAASAKVTMKIRTYSHYSIAQGCFWPVAFERSGAFPPATVAFLEFLRSTFSLTRNQIASITHVLSRSIHAGMAQIVEAYAHRATLHSNGMSFPSALVAMQVAVRAHDDRRAASARLAGLASERHRIFSPAPLPPLPQPSSPPPPRHSSAPAPPPPSPPPPFPHPSRFVGVAAPLLSPVELAAWTFFSKEDLRDICRATSLSPSGSKLELATSLFYSLGPIPPQSSLVGVSAAIRDTAARIPASILLPLVPSPASSQPLVPTRLADRPAAPSRDGCRLRPASRSRAPSPDPPIPSPSSLLYPSGRSPRTPNRSPATRSLSGGAAWFPIAPRSSAPTPPLTLGHCFPPLASDDDSEANGSPPLDLLQAPLSPPLGLLPHLDPSPLAALGGVPLPSRLGLFERCSH